MNLKLDQRGDDVRALHSELQLLGIAVPEGERQQGLFGPGTREAIVRFQTEQGLPATGIVDAATAAALETAVADTAYTVSGFVMSPDRAGVGGLRVRVVDRNVGEDVELAVATTNLRGHYTARFGPQALTRRRKAQPDIQAQVFAHDTLIGTSAVRYNAGHVVTLHVALPANVAALPSEHETLTAALAAHYTGRLGALQETKERPDITYLANKTGWDARAVALAALADQLAQAQSAGTVTGTGTDAAPAAIPAALFYALLRAGVPAEPATLYRTSVKTVQHVWKRAIAQGVVPRALGAQLPQALQTFHRLAAANALGAPVFGRVSTLQDMVRLSLGDDAQRHRQFADIYTRLRNDLPAFWAAIGQAFGEDTTRRLQLDGQLGQLTCDNVPLLQGLRDAERAQPLTAMAQLAHRGYHRAEKWAALIGDAGPVPAHVPGATPAERRARYAELLAAQVRLRFPTAVVAARVRAGELPLAAGDGAREAVATLLTQHQAEFVIGMHPLDRYLRKKEIFDQVDPAVRQEIKRLQRVYQVTPTDAAMTVLLQRNVDSAYKISRYSETEFLRAFGGLLESEADARFVHRRARQVHNAVVNVAASYVAARRAQALGSDTNNRLLEPFPDPAAVTAPDGGDDESDVIVSPTLEDLFGSLDFCSCEDCASILSPAAYLVDLLHTLDRQDNVLENPQTVLLERRPDLQYLPLSCENTNTALPYIDVVNEALEYFVANGLSLADYTGYDTGDTVTSEELLAAPQNVDPDAYTALHDALFPPPLPFHRALEALRRTFSLFEVKLPDAMETLRVDDAVDRAAADAYGWRDVLMERVGLSRAEYALLTDSSLTLQQIYGYEPADDARADLSFAKTFARRMDLEYQDVVDLLETAFINPDSVLIPRLNLLGVPVAVLQAIKDHTISTQDEEAFDTLVATLDPTQYGGQATDDAATTIKAWIRDDATYARIMGLIVLLNPINPDDLCSFDDLVFRFADPAATDPVRTIDFVRLQRFVRLWKKLGWTMEQTDQVIAALYPADQLPGGADEAEDLTRLDAGFVTLLARLGLVLKVMERLRLRPKKDLPGVLALFAPIGVYGDTAPYRTMFLNPTALALDEAFGDDGYGNVPKGKDDLLLDHRDALRAAFQLTDDELTLITTELGYTSEGADPTKLTLDNVTAVYRRGWLARKLRLSVSELLLLARYARLDPFAPPDPPDPAIIRFLDLVQALAGASLKPVQALYLLWNEDVSGQSAPSESEVTEVARVLRTDFAQTEIDFALTDDPTGEIARARMALVYGSDATDFYFGVLANTLATSVQYSPTESELPQGILDVAGGRLSYDDFRKRLSYAGVLLEADSTLLAGVPGISADLQTAILALYQAGQDAIDPFFERYPELRDPYLDYAVSTASPEEKWTALLAEFLPELKRRRKRQQVISDVAAASAADSALVQAVLDDATVLRAAADATAPALDDLLAVETDGAIGADGFSGYVQPPESGSYDLTIETDAGATVTLTLDGEAVLLDQDGGEWSNHDELALTAGRLYAFELVVTNAAAAPVVSWATSGRGWEPIPGTALYAADVVGRLRDAYVRLLKIASLASALRLTAAETAELASRAAYQVDGQGWLNVLPVTGAPDDTTSEVLRDRLVALLDFARLKAAYAPDDERLLEVLQDPTATLETGESLLLTVTGWDDVSAGALLTRFGNKTTADLTDLDLFVRVDDALALVKKTGITAEALVAAATNEPSDDVVADLQAALRARYDEDDWLAAIKPVNDAMRALQRDALVAYVLRRFAADLDPAKNALDTADKLFEYFLMDVQMDPCMQTSRIRHALSTVQLFVERCLLSLEPRVSPSSIDADQWKWMKRYRVWEANRKVFLWPENWLEPELRDDQSPIFKEVMGELLGNDITEDTAANAMLDYLSKLEEVARLSPCGIHYQEADDDHDEVVHAVARSLGASRKYFYRRRESGTWTPWDQIKLDIEDEPVIPVVWKDRVFLMWLRLLKTGPVDAQTADAPFGDNTSKLKDVELQKLGEEASTQAQNVQTSHYVALCYSEYSNGKWLPTRTSDVDAPLLLGQFAPAGDDQFDRTSLRLTVDQEADDEDDLDGGDPSLRVTVTGTGVLADASFVLHNTHSVPETDGDFEQDTSPIESRALSLESDQLTVEYAQLHSPTEDPDYTEHPVISNVRADQAVWPRHGLQNPWDAPFFYRDARHVFYVTTEQGSAPDAGYGPSLPSKPVQVDLPPIVLQVAAPIRDPAGPVEVDGNPGLIDTVSMEHFVTEDANIRTAIGTSGGVRYDGSVVGPNGSTFQQ
jgi:hypothetical protein